MIKTEKEYTQSKKRLEEEFRAIEQQQNALKKSGLTDEQLKLALDPLASFAFQLKEEIAEYERLMRGDFGELTNFYGMGRLLVALRIFKGMKQSELASKLGVKDSQVSRDENNEYHGASIEKVQKVLEVLGIQLKTTIESPYDSKSA
jgi:DNA-binding XRE family transcriptional regulator